MTTVDKSTKVYSTFDPRIIQDCVLWLDGADSSRITLSSTTITDIKDKSLSGRTITITNTVSYDSTNKRIVFTDTNGRFAVTGLPSSTYDCLFVCTANASNTGYRALLRASGSPGLDPFLLNAGTNNVGMWTGSAFAQFGTLTQTPNEKALFYTTMNSSKQIQASKNGTSTLTTATSTSAFSGQIVTIGNDTLGGQPFGWLHELLIFNRTITSTERIQVEGYLAWKWALQASLPVGHTYISRGPFLSPFRPTDISNCGLWLDGADAASVLGTTNVTQWTDKSGNGRNFTATTGPAYSSSTMTFNGSTQKLDNTSWNSFSRINHTLIAVHKPDSNTPYVGNTRLFSIQQTAGTPYVVFPYLNNTTANGYINDGNASTNPATSGKTLLDGSVTSAFNIITASISSSVQTIYRNGTVTDTRSYSIGNATITTGVNIGGQYAEWYKGSVREIIIYTSALSLNDVNTIEGYLAWKWGLQANLPSTHPYKNFYPLKVN